MDGRQASFELRPYLDESLPQNVLEGKPSASCMGTLVDPPYFHITQACNQLGAKYQPP